MEEHLCVNNTLLLLSSAMESMENTRWNPKCVFSLFVQAADLGFLLLP